MMSEQQLEKQLNQQGYTSVGMIKLRGDTYEARAFKGGQSLAIEADARTGKVLSADPAPRD
jgi:Peptidase propeptide and YPEB domain